MLRCFWVVILILLTLFGLITQSFRDLSWVDSPRRYYPRWAVMDSVSCNTCQPTMTTYWTCSAPINLAISVIPGFSGHGFVIVNTVLKPLLSKKTPRKILKYSRADWASIRQSTMDISQNTIQSGLGGLGVEELNTSFMDQVKSLERFIPATWSWVRTDVPWLTRDLKWQCNNNKRKTSLVQQSKKDSQTITLVELPWTCTCYQEGPLFCPLEACETQQS